ncbi:MAG: cytochrome ubiquinol oxidase subunit I, partial [Desulfobulbaceae bacterium]|nr:cytochrome ubiquinol oxidase subunit I [Desulfobulbaceae bacterium]
MNYPIWETLRIGGPTLIALIAVFHVFVAHMAVGGGLFLWLTDIKGYREQNPEIHGYLKKYLRFFLLLSMVFGAVTGVGIWFIIALVSPEATAILIHNFVFGWATEWVFFLGEIVALLIYYYFFDTMSRKIRLRISFLYFLFAWLSLFAITGIVDFMLTPGLWLQSRDFWDGFFNPTFWPSLFFRSFMAFTLAGLFGCLTTVFLEDRNLRKTLLRYCTKWLLFPLIGLVPSAFWYMRAVPPGIREEAFQMNRAMPAFLDTLLAMTLVLFLLGIVLSVMKARFLQKAAAFLLVPVGLFWIGSFEYSRENARRPFLIVDYLYSNSIRVSEVEKLNREGIL